MTKVPTPALLILVVPLRVKAPAVMATLPVVAVRPVAVKVEPRVSAPAAVMFQLVELTYLVAGSTGMLMALVILVPEILRALVTVI